MATKIKLEVDVAMRGVWIEGRAGPLVREFNEDAKKLVTTEGENQLRQRIPAKTKKSTGKFAGSISTHDFAKGRTIAPVYPQVLYGPWLEGTSTRNASTRFKGYRFFKLTRAWLKKNVGPIVQDRFRELIAKLNGGGG